MIKESDLESLTDVMFGNKWASVLEPKIINNQLVFKNYRCTSQEKMLFKRVLVKVPLSEIQGAIIAEDDEENQSSDIEIEELAKIHFQVLGLF